MRRWKMTEKKSPNLSSKNTDREFADRALFVTVEGLLDRNVPHYDIARALFDLSISIAAGPQEKSARSVHDFGFLLEYFASTPTAWRDQHVEVLKRLSEE